jgi:hypothetical protein
MWSQKSKHFIVLLAVMAGPAWCAEMGAAAIRAGRGRSAGHSELHDHRASRMSPDLF